MKDELLKTVTDKTRRISQGGKKIVVVHKFNPDGSQQKAPIHYTDCTASDFEFIDAWKAHKWDAEAAGKSLGLTERQIRWRVKKLSFIEQEDKIMRAKTKMLSPDYVIAKDLDNLEKVNRLEDTDHKSLDRLAKVQGMFKTSDVSITNNIFQMPTLSPEQAAELKALGDRLASVDTEVV